MNVDGGIGHFVLTPRLQPFLAHSVEIAVRDRMGDLVREGFNVSIRFGLPEPWALKSRLLTGIRQAARGTRVPSGVLSSPVPG